MGLGNDYTIRKLYLYLIVELGFLISTRSVVKHHDTKFTVILSPDNGPGKAAWPSATYINAVKTLNVYSNVLTLGYVDTSGGKRDNATVRAEIATYAGWNNVSADFALHGIYFDHTPWKHDEKGEAKEYLRNISATVRHTDGWAGPGEAIVVHDPGRLPDVELMAYKPDITVIFNGTYDELPTREALDTALKGRKERRDDFAMLAHSVPSDLGRTGLRKIVESLRREVEWLCVTDLKDQVWNGYASFLEEFLDITW